MIIKFLSFGQKVWNLIKRIFNKPKVKFIIIIIIAFFAIYYFYVRYEEIQNLIQNLNLNYSLLILGLVIVVINTLLGVTNWWLIISWLGYKNKWIDIVKGYSISTLAKYIPGSIWQYAGRAYFMQEFSIPAKVVGVAIFTEFLIITFNGIILAGITTLLTQLDFYIKTIIFQSVLFSLAIISFIFLILYPKMVKLFIKRINLDFTKLDNKFYMLVNIFSFLGWILMGSAYWLISMSFGMLNLDYPTALFFHSAAFVSGNIVLFIPNGLVVREALLIMLGKGYFDETLLVFSSLVFRLVILISEIITTSFILIVSINGKYNWFKNSSK